MRAATHLAFAGLTGVVAAGFGPEPGIVGAAALAAGALLPDIDSQHSGLGRMIKPLSGRLERSFGHRTITHSFLGMLVFALLFSWLLFVYPKALLWLLAGIFSHILLDTANVVGVPLFYPNRLQFWLVSNRAWRVPYNSPKEFSWLGLISVLAICLLPISMDGFSPWFHRLLGTPYGAVEDYLLWRENYEVWVDIAGHNLLSDEDINGRYLIIDALGDEELLVEDSSGRAFSVGLSSAANIHSRHLSVWRGQASVTSTYRLDLSGRLVSDLIYALPKGAKRVHLNAALKLKGDGDTPPVVGYFKRVEKIGDTYHLRSASLGDLAPLAHLLIEAGSAVIRAEYSPGAEVLADLSLLSSSAQLKSHLLSLPDLPSLSGLLVELGDRVEAGELIARYINEASLELAQAEMDAALAKLPRLLKSFRLEQEAHDSRLEALAQALKDAEAKQSRVAYLVERNAEPRVSLLAAEVDLRKAREAILTENTAWTSQKNRLEQSIQDVQLTISKAKKEQVLEMDRQWVKAPLAGTISDIRLVKVTTKGIDLELMLLEEVE